MRFGGNVALTPASDTYTTTKWADLGPTIPLTYDCVPNP